MVIDWVPIQPLASVARIVKVNVPALEGVPLMAPVAALKKSPEGRAPAETAYV